MLRMLVMVSSLAACCSALAQSAGPETPKKLLGFFKPGMNVGIQSDEGTLRVIIHTYTEMDFGVAKQIARYGRRMIAARELANENDLVRVALDQFIESLDSATSAEDDISVMPLIRTSLGKLTAVGDDYLLIELDGKDTKRLVISESSISQVYLDASPIRFYSRRARTAPSAGE